MTTTRESRATALAGLNDRTGLRLCVDENINRSRATLLEQKGHNVVRVQGELELGFEDEAIVAFCRKIDRVLLTNDDDFFAFGDHPGVLFLAAQRTPPREAVLAIQRIDRYVDDMHGRVWHIPDGWT